MLLNETDVNFLLNEIKKHEEKSSAIETFLMNSEIEQLREIDIEDFIWKNPEKIEPELKAFRRQFVFNGNDRVDILLQRAHTLFIVEIKLGPIGKEVYDQLHRYVKAAKEHDKLKQFNEIKGIIVCERILPICEEYYLKKIENKDLMLYLYGWKFSLQ